MSLRSEYPSEYNAWVSMRQRCTNQNHAEYFRYGAVGITFSKEFDSFIGFFEHLGAKPRPDYSLDRIDSRKGYSPDNCRWVSKAMQSFNQKVSADCKTKISGVFFREKFNTYRCFITVEGKQINLGSTRDFFEACCKRKAAELYYYKETKLK